MTVLAERVGIRLVSGGWGGGNSYYSLVVRLHPPLGIQAQSQAKLSYKPSYIEYKSSNLVSTRPSVRIFLRSKKEEEEAQEDHFRKGAITINKLTVNSYFGIDVVTKQ